ncbi:MAG: molecular chaperone DnaK [Candidatus Terrybacteria bacterium CG10_big_fil_rev_8_21_14_0_10_41_10]|uniref:Chaperone protein DnaK n=1 Tax=Candidatus Terrybacteria bacterium CG10_big_fil_rev_8_21_14_0_10_41_10 TaxID=1975026 RepID=A0A2M8LA87_9BACT|nr:MAG: molecular chaperone DnaK [Candidatus Terrybacteria bacterium CG10_big_fil_rev_8_21_14_0_10_41_10]
MSNTSKILGIDLGTTNSAISIIEAGEPKVLENDEGGRTTPSIVAMSKSGDRLVGLLAKRQAVTNPTNTVYSVKRLIGRKFEDEEVTRDKELMPYKIERSESGGVKVVMGDKSYSPEEVSAMILQKLKHDAEARVGGKIEEAIITVPAYFNDAQRKATKDAGEIAGLKVLRIINEPTAAALAYGLNKKKNEKIVVYDLGGGTFDVSVLEVGDDVIEVKSTNGDTHLGGEDFDNKIISWIVTEFKKESGIDVSKDVLALQRLKEAAEKSKHELSSTFEAEINIPFITSDASGPKHLQLKLSRNKLEEMVDEYIKKTIEITKRAVSESSFQISDVDEVVLVGGQTRMPAIQKAVKEFFGKEPNKSINPDEVVAIGAAVQGGILRGDVKDILLLDVTPLSLGIETMGGVATKIINKNTTIPTSKSQVFSTAADNQPSVEIHVIQGEREMAADNKTLGRFILDGVPPSPRGLPQIEVTFDIDVNGILNVKAKDKATNKEQSIKIEASSGLSPEDIERMKKDAEAHASEDKRKREIAEVKNNANSLVYTTEKSLSDASDKVTENIKNDVKLKLEELKKVRDGEDAAAIKTATDNLSKSLQAIGEAMYKQQDQKTEPQAGQSGQQTQDTASGEARDAEFEEKKEGDQGK